METEGGVNEASVAHLLERLSELPCSKLYPELVSRLSGIVTTWSQKFPATFWYGRLNRKNRLLKELNESVPILDIILKVFEQVKNSETRGKITVVDLCSGFGYLSMFLSELLEPALVHKIAMVDKEWPFISNLPNDAGHGDEVKQGEVDSQSADHSAQGETEDKVEKVKKKKRSMRGHITTDHVAMEGWPIPLEPRKVNLKKSREIRNLARGISRMRAESGGGPVILSCIHLCNQLSIRAVELFNMCDDVSTLLLKPCCLPGSRMAYAKLEWPLANNVVISAEELQAVRGKHQLRAAARSESKADSQHPKTAAEKNEKDEDSSPSNGPSESMGSHDAGAFGHPKFDMWCGLLFEGIGPLSEYHKQLAHIRVQTGHFQNTYIVATRPPYCPPDMEGVERSVHRPATSA